MAGEVFISYRRADEAWARLLHAQLEAEGVDAWYDVQVGAGEDWRSATARALESSRVFVLLFSRAAAESADIAKELAAATFQGKLVVPVRLEDVQPTGAFLYELASRNWVNAHENTEARLGELAKSLAALVRSGQTNPAMLPFDRNAGTAQRPRARRSLPRWTVAAGVALAAVIALTVFTLRNERTRAAPSQKTAFFGFETSGDDPALAAIAASASAEVFNALGAMRLETAARGETLGVAADARFQRALQLDATYALSGEVLREAAQVTVSIRLDDVSTRSTLWSESVSGAPGEDVALPVRAATLATDTLRCVADMRAALPHDDGATVKLLPRACREIRTTSVTSIPIFRELVRAAPDAAEAQAAFAITVLIALTSAPETARAALFAEAQAAAERAMALDPLLPDSWLARYWVAVRAGRSLSEVEAILVEGLRVAPEDATLNQYRSSLLQGVGRQQEALPHARLSVGNDPLSGPKQSAFADLLAVAGLRGEAAVAADRLLTRWPSAARWQTRMRNAVLHHVEDPGVVLAAPPADVAAGSVACWREIATAYASQDPARRREGVATAKTCRARGELTSSEVGLVIALGDLDGALALLSEPAAAAALRFPGGSSVLFWPSTRALRADPRFVPLAEELGLSAYWRATGSRPDVCTTETAPFCAITRR